jgi:hypothetical protein
MGPDPFIDVDAIARWGEASGIAGIMHSRWGWPIVEVLHFIGLCLLFGAVALFDLRMLGMARGVRLSAVHRMIPFGLAGFALSIATGLMFLVTMPDQYVYNPAIQTKFALLLLAGVNMALFYATTARAVAATADDALPPLRARLFGAVSLLCWLGVITCGRVITAYRPPHHWCFWCGVAQ